MDPEASTLPTAHSHPIVSPTDYSSIANIVGFLGVVIAVVSVLTKTWTKLLTVRKFATDDIAHGVSLAFSIGMGVSIYFACQNGLGRLEASLTDGERTAFQKSIFASELMYTTTLFFSKLSVLILLKELTPMHLQFILIHGVAGFLALWAISSIFVTSFQCPLPSSWKILSQTGCIDQVSFWICFGLFNLFSELLLLAVSVFVISKIQIARSRKVVICSIFGLRLFVVVAILAEIVFTSRILGRSDRTMASWPVVVSQLAVQTLSITFACTPYLKPFFVSLESGIMRMDNTEQPGRVNPNSASWISAKLKSRRKSAYRGVSSRWRHSYRMKDWSQKSYSGGASKVRVEPDRASQHSDSRIINTTTTIQIQTENREAENMPHSFRL